MDGVFTQSGSGSTTLAPMLPRTVDPGHRKVWEHIVNLIALAVDHHLPLALSVGPQ